MLKKALGLIIFAFAGFSISYADSTPPSSSVPLATASVPSSYMPVDIHESFQSILQRMSSAKQAINDRQQVLLKQRYDLSDIPSKTVMMAREKPIQEGVRV